LPVGAPVAPPRGHAAFVVDPFEPALERLAGLGFEAADRRRHWGARRVFVAAPGGHRIELMEAPPGQS
jgi:catechol 2,3-dioxygenase-like lactoylglutathione lyase family enzyme